MPTEILNRVRRDKEKPNKRKQVQSHEIDKVRSIGGRKRVKDFIKFDNLIDHKKRKQEEMR